MPTKEEFTDEDMAAVGRATMAAIETHADIGWHPSDCPSEIVGDLRNQRDELRDLLLWVLFHHQGATSPVGQPIRRALGIGKYDQLTVDQIRAGSRQAELVMQPN